MAGNTKYRILYEDQDVIVVWKAAGVPVQSARSSVPDVMSMIRNAQMERDGKAPQLYPVNRLDQPVEGIFLIACNEKAAADLNRQVQQKSSMPSKAQDGFRMEKLYRAMVCGKLSDQEGTLVDYLIKDGRTNISRVVPEGTKDGRRSVLHYRVLQEWKDRTLLEIQLMTGRHHQIRVQLAHAGHPIVGDAKYGTLALGGLDELGAVRRAPVQLCLCSFKTTFLHPQTKKPMSFQAEQTFPVPPTVL